MNNVLLKAFLKATTATKLITSCLSWEANMCLSVLMNLHVSMVTLLCVFMVTQMYCTICSAGDKVFMCDKPNCAK